MYYILSGCIYICKYTSITMISFQQNRPIQTLQKLFHSEGSTYTNTIKKTTTTDFKGFKGFERWRVWKIQELYKVRENGTKDPLKVIMTEWLKFEPSRVTKVFPQRRQLGGGRRDRTGLCTFCWYYLQNIYILSNLKSIEVFLRSLVIMIIIKIAKVRRL